MGLPTIQVNQLCKRYGELLAVDHISFEVPAGATYALLGGNGAGKTTTLSMLLGLLLPTSGSIQVLGVDMVKNRFDALPRMNFTSPYVDLPHRLTVGQNLDIYARLYAVRRRAERIKQLAEQFDLSALLKRDYGTLSAGQRTRVSLAKSLLNEPKVLLMDEPTASLDPPRRTRCEPICGITSSAPAPPFCWPPITCRKWSGCAGGADNEAGSNRR